ncbi:MAG: hypothetical protein IJ830_05135 [Alphaproteobacteria bacterium]|nr:hypothetical protein [Alphaproteobacteria bacterium]
MIKKIFISLFAIALISSASIALAEMPESNTPYTKQLSKSERENICQSLKAQKPKKTEVSTDNPIVPASAFNGVYEATANIYHKVADISVLGDALMCHAAHAGKNEIKILGVTLFSYPDISVWLCGFIIYFCGFMLLLGISFYIVDISFKLGMVVILLPIGIALWPFEWTKDKLTKLISIILKSAGIFIFLAITVPYSLNMLSSSIGGLESIFEAIDNENTDLVSETFSLFSLNFLIIMAVLIYSQKMVSSTIQDYVDKFFPDAGFGGGSGAYPMHHLSTQAIDFAKKKVVAPVASFAGDVAMTQAGRATAAVGRGMNSAVNKLTNASSPAPKNTAAGTLQRASRGILRAPGMLLERVGGAMQDHKGKSKSSERYDRWESQREKEEREKAAQEEAKMWEN